MPPRARSRAGPAESPISVSSETPTPDRPPIPLPPRRSSSRLRDLETLDHAGPGARASASPERPGRALGGAGGSTGAGNGHLGQERPRATIPGRDPRGVPAPIRPVRLAIPTASSAAAGPSSARALPGAAGRAIPPNRPASPPPWDDQQTDLLVLDQATHTTAGSSRAASVLAVENDDGPARQRTRPRTSVIDLTGDDDDDVEITGEAIPQRRPGGRRRSPNTGPLWSDLRRLDRVVDDREAATRAILDDPDLPPANEMRARGVYPQPHQPRRNVAVAPQAAPHHPPPIRQRDGVFQFHHEDDDAVIDWPENMVAPEPEPPAPRPRIGFGGAVYRGQGRHIQYNAPPAHRARAIPDGVLNAAIRRAQIDEAAHAQVIEARNARIALARADMPQRNQAQVDGLERRLANRLREAGAPWDMMGGRAAGGLAELYGRMLGGLGGRLPPGLEGLNMPGLMGLEGNIAQGDPQQIITQVTRPAVRHAEDGYTVNFDVNDRETIEIDQTFTEAEISKRYIACVNCFHPLHLSSGQKSPAERVWALRCGHLIDQECLELVAAPQVSEDRDNINRPPPAGLEVLGQDEGQATGTKGRKAKKPRNSKSKKTAAKPVEYVWYCPAKGCEKKHLSMLKDAEWKQDEMEGAVQAYA